MLKLFTREQFPEGPIRVAVVGVGYLGQFHAEKYARSEQANLIAVVDADRNRADEIAKKFSTRALTDYRELPALGVQAASVASSTTTHFEIAAWLLENGIDVLVEKPMCSSVADAKRLIEIAARHNRILQVGHLERFNPAFQAVKPHLSRAGFIEARRIAKFTGRGHDVDVIYDLMIHDIDIICHLVGRPIARLEAVGIPVLTKSADIANARLVFEGGAIANVTASRAAQQVERTIRIFQHERYISLDFGKKKLKIYSRDENAISAGIKGFLGIPEIKMEEFPVEERDALRDQIESFIKAVKNGTAPEVSGEDGLRALELADRIRAAIDESLKNFDGEIEQALKLRTVNAVQGSSR